MIKDNIKNANLYYNVSKQLEIGLKYLENTDFSHVENGKYEISGKDVYAIVQDYFSKPKDTCKFEAHKKYTDIQYIVKGGEQMGVSEVDNFTDLITYDKEKDIVFLTQKDGVNPTFINMCENEFIIFTPKDAHMPSVAIEHAAYVKKVVVKVLEYTK